VVEDDATFGLVKVSPLVAWTSAQVWNHLREHRVPTSTLHARGYSSIGCWPCTTPVAAGEDPRAGRWRGQGKSECGLHLRPLVGQGERPLAACAADDARAATDATLANDLDSSPLVSIGGSSR
jgi:3'-phosphoadenosine 5'-phosphosulfate sulfotransferase (PAPS reductase)/FAD synthetase